MVHGVYIISTKIDYIYKCIYINVCNYIIYIYILYNMCVYTAQCIRIYRKYKGDIIITATWRWSTVLASRSELNDWFIYIPVFIVFLGLHGYIVIFILYAAFCILALLCTLLLTVKNPFFYKIKEKILQNGSQILEFP